MLGITVKTLSCEHLCDVEAYYLNNDNQSPPVIFIKNGKPHMIMSLTNQYIRVCCSLCWEKMKLSGC